MSLFLQNILEYLKGNTSLMKLENLKQGRFPPDILYNFSPLIYVRSVADPEYRNERKAHGFLKTPMRIDIVGSRSVP
jgi:hypothetical protein